jgi:hypothetical protein
MRHDPFTRVFNRAYINHIVRFNIQDTFLENNISNNRLTWAFIYISIRYNLGVPNEIPNEVIEFFFVADLDIIYLEQQFKALSTEIK